MKPCWDMRMKKKVIYIIDDINYVSGAQKVTIFQIKKLQEYYDIYVLSLTKPQDSLLFLERDHILAPHIWKKTGMYAVSLKKVMDSNEYSLKQKLGRVFYALCLRIGKGEWYFERLIDEYLRPLLETFDDIIVVSESSKMRHFVSTLKKPRKIQWIHTDYARWSEFSEWSKAVTRNDADIYIKYDHVVALSEHCKNGLVKKIPSIADKIVVVPNLIDGDSILRLSQEKSMVTVPKNCLKLITVARLDKEKGLDQLLRKAAVLKGQTRFKWYVIGDGPDRSELEHLREKLNLEDAVEFLGYMKNPYPIMRQCDVLVLLSKYEGMPVTIDEAMVLGIGIIAPAIGGIPEQVKEYKSCVLSGVPEFEKILLNWDFSEREQFDYQASNSAKIKMLQRII